MARDDLTWLVIDDFRPGIRTRGEKILGSATDLSYGCIAAETGELIPLPKATFSYTPTRPATANVLNNDLHLNGFHVAGPLSGAAVASGVQIEFHLAYEWIDTNGGNNREYRWERHQIFANPVVIDTIKSISCVTANPSNSVRGTFFDDARMDPSTATNPGVPVVAAGWYEEGGGGQSFVSVYPDPASPSSNNEYDISTSLDPDIIVSHQGRLVIFDQEGWAHGSPGSWISNEQIWYTNINLPTLETSVAQTFATDRMTGIGVAQSVSAAEFLIIKFDEGAYAVSGDFSNPTVIRLPGVAPTHGATIVPVYTPLGLVYCQLGGSVYAWGGGDTAIDIAPYLEDGFWQHPNSAIWYNYNGRLALWRDKVVLPRGWLMDTKTNSWWRLNPITDSRQYLHAATDYTGSLLCAYDKTSSASAQVAVEGYGSTPREDYYWESNRIVLGTRGRQFEVREVILDVENEGTVEMFIYGDKRDGDAVPTSMTFTAPGSGRDVERKAVRFKVGNVLQFDLTAESVASGFPAPEVFSVRIGYRETTAINQT
jgi:hypothetical protein